jgi:hypothetical protein
MNQRAPAKFSVLFAAGCLAVAPAVADWSGKTIGLAYYDPDLDTLVHNSGTAFTVTDGVELTGYLGIFDIDFSGSQIRISVVGDNVGFTPATAFNGFRFFDALGSAQSLVSATINLNGVEDRGVWRAI